ncbi:MAG: primase-helicase family protein [Chloroflexota bacterium]
MTQRRDLKIVEQPPGSVDAEDIARRLRQQEENRRIGDELGEPIITSEQTADEMLENLVFVVSGSRIVDRRTRRVRKLVDAQNELAASRTTYDDQQGKARSGPTLKRWLEHKERLTTGALMWDPKQDEFGREPEGNEIAYNTWRGLPAAPDAPTNWKKLAKPFIDHMEYLIPVAQERHRFIQWLAHIFKDPATLPHTSYLMVTETTGIGRNWLSSVLVRLLPGSVAAGISITDTLDGSFNGRLSQKLLAVVDETREGMAGKDRYRRAERLKSELTAEFRHINPKYGHQIVERNCCRWLMFSNHLDALPFDNHDRRVIVIANPTDRKSEAYYARLYGLVDDPKFIASVRRYLEEVNVASFNPGAHAPLSTAKQRALEAMATEEERACAAFKREWPGNLAGRRDVRAFVSQQMDVEFINENHLTHAIRRAGMGTTGVRITRQTNMPQQKDTVVIVRPERVTLDEVQAASTTWLRQQILDAATTADREQI